MNHCNGLSLIFYMTSQRFWNYAVRAPLKFTATPQNHYGELELYKSRGKFLKNCSCM